MTSDGCGCGHGRKPMVIGVDPAKRAVGASLAIPTIASDIAVDGGTIWADDNDLGHLYRIAYR